MIGIGFSYMIVGMGVVFLFLIILVFIVKTMSYISNRYFPEEETITEYDHSIERDNDIIAAITAAVESYKER